jgi:hypothetical protein
LRDLIRRFVFKVIKINNSFTGLLDFSSIRQQKCFDIENQNLAEDAIKEIVLNNEGACHIFLKNLRNKNYFYSNFYFKTKKNLMFNQQFTILVFFF